MKFILKSCLSLAVLLSVTASFAADEKCCAAQNQKPLKVLMVGNSFSICVLKEMPKIAKDLGQPLDLCSLFIPGCSLERHCTNTKRPEAYAVGWDYVSCAKDKVPFKPLLNKWSGASLTEMLKADKWDIVTIQQASHESWKPETYEPYGTKVIETIQKLAPQAKIYVQQTWSYTLWAPRFKQWGIDQNQMFDKLEAAYATFAKNHQLDMIMTGKAIQRYRKELPVVYGEKANDDDVVGGNTFKEVNGKWTMTGDVIHLNDRGNYLQGLVWTAKLFNVDVTKSTYVPKCLENQPERAVLMRKIANDLR